MKSTIFHFFEQAAEPWRDVRNDTAIRKLKEGDKLCRENMTSPMSRDLRDEVKHIYKRCRSRIRDNTVLIMALEMGCYDIALGFVKCAKQENVNLDTGETGYEHVQQFCWITDQKKKKTAFEVAVEKDRVEMARLLWDNGQPDHRRKALPLLLKKPKYESFIFDMLEDEKQANHHELLIHTNPPGVLKLYNKGGETIVLPDFLDKLGNSSLFGSNACNNTVLHLVSKMGNLECVEYILGKYPSQICSHNSDMETPAFVAAREGRADNLQLLITSLKQKNEDVKSNVTRSTDKNSALHISIQNHHVEVAYLLVEQVPELAKHMNESKESPLYLAAERGYFGVVEFILKKMKHNEIAIEGPNGKTALHAAAISDSAECVEFFLREKPDLLKVHDKHGWTALHHAVYHNCFSAVRKLLEADYSVGYELVLEEDGIYTSTTAIHIAAGRGHCESMKVVIEKCPGCTEFIDHKGRNILHVAVENKKNKAIEFIFQDESLSKLINQKDKNGNTPIHLLVVSNFEMMEMLMDPRVNISVRNNENMTPLDMISSDDQKERLIKAMNSIIHDKAISPLSLEMSRPNDAECEVKEKTWELKERKISGLFGTVEGLVVLNALIATASFAAALQVPGGYNSSDGFKQGTPFLLKKAAFQAFMVTNALAFSFSCSVLGLFADLQFFRGRLDLTFKKGTGTLDRIIARARRHDEALLKKMEEQEWHYRRTNFTYLLSAYALIAMRIAFVTGMYVVLSPSHALAISICVMCLFLMLFTWRVAMFFRWA